MKILSIPLDEIDASGRTRPVSEAAARQMAADIAERGQRQPVEVARVKGGGWRLVSGGHRYLACRLLGRTAIDALEVKGNDLELRRDEHLDNLTSNTLTMLERAVALADLRRIYTRLHPETKRGGDRKSADFKQENQSANFAFCSAVVARSEIKRRAILQSAAIGDGLAASVIERLRGSAIEDNQRELELLSRQAARLQVKIVGLLLQAENPARTVAEAIGRIEGRTAADAQQKALSALVDRWGRMPKAARRAWVMALPEDQADELAGLLAQRVNHLEEAA